MRRDARRPSPARPTGTRGASAAGPARWSAARIALAPLAVAGSTVAGLVGLVACGPDGDGEWTAAERQAEVAERGASVMPFDLEVTTHRFEPRDDGLVQTVVADDPSDDDQVALVREHLADEAERFAAGDLGDPAAIHGHDMPGLAELEDGFPRIAVEYTDVTAGARITYTTTDPGLVAALHEWSEAQLSDHGADAQSVGEGDDP